MNDSRKHKFTPFKGKEIEVLTPDGFIMPLFYGLQALLGRHEVDGKKELYWTQNPMTFLNDNFDKIVKDYMGNLSLCEYDPQKVGKASKLYDDSVKAFKMVMAGIL